MNQYVCLCVAIRGEVFDPNYYDDGCLAMTWVINSVCFSVFDCLVQVIMTSAVDWLLNPQLFTYLALRG